MGKKQLTWSDVKTRLTDFDRTGLLALVQDLYAASKNNRAFLHARFNLGDDALKPYKTTIARWLYPDVLRSQDISIAKAKKAISDYKKAIGQAEGLVELAYPSNPTTYPHCFNNASIASGVNGSNSSIRLFGQVGSFSKVSSSHLAGLRPLSFAVPSRV